MRIPGSADAAARERTGINTAYTEKSIFETKKNTVRIFRLTG